MLHGTFAAFVKDVWTEELENTVTVYNFEVDTAHTYFVGKRNVLVHNQNCVLKELGANSFDDVGRKYNPNQLINKLDDMGYSKKVTFKSAHSGPSTIMTHPSGNHTFRIQSSPANGKSYFRVMNSHGNYLDSFGRVLSNVTSNELRNLTHFYFL